jgi:hypothetical protein
MVKNKPKNGDNIIDLANSGLSEKRIASFQFQRFLDEVEESINTLNDTIAILEQRVYDLENP